MVGYRWSHTQDVLIALGGAGYKMLVIPVNRKLQIDVSHTCTHIFSVFIFVLIRIEPWVPSPRMIFLMQSVLLLL